jgi:hypothetical protein
LEEVRDTVGVDEFGGCRGGVPPALLLAVTEAVLLKVEAFAEGGGVEVDD